MGSFFSEKASRTRFSGCHDKAILLKELKYYLFQRFTIMGINRCTQSFFYFLYNRFKAAVLPLLLCIGRSPEQSLHRKLRCYRRVVLIVYQIYQPGFQF